MGLDHTVSPLPCTSFQLTWFPSFPTPCYGLEKNQKSKVKCPLLHILPSHYPRLLEVAKTPLTIFFFFFQREETWIKCYDMTWDGRDYSLIVSIVSITTEIAESGHTSNLFLRYLEFEGQTQALFFKLFLCTNISQTAINSSTMWTQWPVTYKQLQTL